MIRRGVSVLLQYVNTQSLTMAKGVQCSGAQRISRREASELKINNHGQTRGKKTFATAWHFSRRASVAAHKEVCPPAQWDSGIIYISLPAPAQRHNSSSSSIADQLLMAQDMGSKYAEGTCF
jgi:hypothetical protein